MKSRARRRGYFLLCGIGVATFVADQLAKLAILDYLGSRQAVQVIPGFFDLVNARNRGAAFGFLNRSDIEWQFWLFLGATAIAFWAIFALARNSLRQPLLLTGLGMILGGAAGNLADRIRDRAVVDYLDFYLGGWHWPAFNVADIGICVGVFLACLATWLGRSPGAERGAEK